MRLKAALSSPLRLMSTRIASGPLQGCRWSLATGRRYRSGEFERERIESIAGLIAPGEVVFDVGAHRGYVSLVAAKAAGSKGRVFAFEPSASNFWFLQRHAAWNRSPEVAPIAARHCAIAASAGEAWFGGGKSLTSSLQKEPSRERVKVESLDALLSNGLPVPTFVKIDVEGAETKVLAGASSLLAQGKTAWLLATHSKELYEECRAVCESHRLTIVDSDRVARAKDLGWDKVEDPEIFAIPPSRTFSADQIARFVAA